MTEPLKAATKQMEAAMLTACVASACSDNPAVIAATAHLALPGNQLRGRCCLYAAGRLGLPVDTAVCLAAVCELLHNASLVHDDLIDRAPKRRGQASTWAHDGDGVAICTGDLMLGAAYGLAAEAVCGTSSRELQRMVHQRTRDVTLGEAAELFALTKMTLTLADYEALARGKSASLLSLSLELPLLASGELEALPFARRLAACFAVAYQIVDDLADVVQDRATNALNVLAVLSSSRGLSEEEARAYACERAMALLEEAFTEGARLPNNCAHVLMQHAERMMREIEEARSAALMSLQG